jgi:soluble lytic murein transglycosylase-like protein
MTTLYRREIEQAARGFGLDPDLLEALVLKESSGHADAFRYEPAFFDRYLAHNPEYMHENRRRVSSSYGLCQVMLSTARDLGFKAEPEMLFVPTVSLHFGAMHLARLLRWAEGHEVKALAAYNGGKGNWNEPGPMAYGLKVIELREAVRKARA